MLNVNMDKHPHRINERRMASLKTEGRAEQREAWSIRIAPFNSWAFCWAPHDPTSVTRPKEAAKPRHTHPLLLERSYSTSLSVKNTKQWWTKGHRNNVICSLDYIDTVLLSFMHSVHIVTIDVPYNVSIFFWCSCSLCAVSLSSSLKRLYRAGPVWEIPVISNQSFVNSLFPCYITPYLSHHQACFILSTIPKYSLNTSCFTNLLDLRSCTVGLGLGLCSCFC